MTPDTRADQRTRAARDNALGHHVVQRSAFRPGKVVGLLPVHLFLLAGWARAAAEKIIDPRWWTTEHLRDFLVDQRPHMLPWFGWLSDHLLVRFAPQVAITVLGMQVGIVVCLAMNRRVSQALWAGVLLNVCFTMAGKVNPSAFYLVMQLTMLFAISRTVSRQVAVRRAGVWLTLAALTLPFARTIHPREVIDDPALMLAFVAALAAVTTLARAMPLDDLMTSAQRWRLRRSTDAWLRRWPGAASQGQESLKPAASVADSPHDGPGGYQSA